MGVVGFSNPLESIDVSVGKSTQVTVTISNNGSVPVHDLSVSIRCNCEGLELSVSPQAVNIIEGGQSADFTLSLTANYTVKPGNYEITLLMNSTEGITDSFSSALVVSVGAVSQTTSSEAELESAPEAEPPAGFVAEETQPAVTEPESVSEITAETVAETIKEVRSKTVTPGTPEEKPAEAKPSEELKTPPALTGESAPEAEPSVLTPSEIPKYEAAKEKEPLSKRLNMKTLIILLSVVIVGLILVMDMANFVDLGIL